MAHQTTSTINITVVNVRPCGLTLYPIVVIRAARGPNRYQGAFHMVNGHLSFTQHFPLHGEIPHNIYHLMMEKAERVVKGEERE